MVVLLFSLVFYFLSFIYCIEDKPKEEVAAEATKETAVGEFHGKKTKLVAKTGGSSVHQWTILEKQGVPAEETPKFVVCFMNSLSSIGS